ncbi:hypothetical protein Aeqsu_1595 [Aequorivita sublithincola DSM 14238]|uniref:Uncharacterized protein n=1 Tax=Aequorivita sublithincola (strain DSM 14238 / LMG 21431 / ACAM 643 / 9-3) TaxID=746697 RepID=I3YVR2_AEQSU|nr:hypothetical protein [Aequorivita sublithincola]AFL81080.1 hypothetical protein Aeqsu_1595 [Aequorivita sublithincola DSM 14238]
MKLKIVFIIFLCFHKGFCAIKSEADPNKVVDEMLFEINVLQQEYSVKREVIFLQLQQTSISLNYAKTIEEKIDLLIAKDALNMQLQLLKNLESRDISKIRYIKGLQIIKILYEKTLSLDHHFSAVSNLRDVNKISNPNNYPEFVQMKDKLKTTQDKRAGFDISNILESNIYTSVVYSFVSMFVNTNTSKAEKDSSLKEVECILDFTLRMHNDLNTIYFETAFLQKKNENISESVIDLFKEYTKPLGYSTGLEECRKNDDWDAVRKNLDSYLVTMDKTMADKAKLDTARSLQINLEFPIDRLLQFITEYNNFINESVNFYEKFGIMLSSYENEQQCASKTPVEYTRLKEGITITIDKFNTAYKPVEINGTKMKQLLYGISEYD